MHTDSARRGTAFQAHDETLVRWADPTLRRAIARSVADVAAMPAGEIEARWRAEVAERLDGRTPATREHHVMRYRPALVAFGLDHPALGVVSARGLSRRITTARRAPARPPSPPRSGRVVPDAGSCTIHPDEAAIEAGNDLIVASCAANFAGPEGPNGEGSRG